MSYTWIIQRVNNEIKQTKIKFIYNTPKNSIYFKQNKIAHNIKKPRNTPPPPKKNLRRKKNLGKNFTFINDYMITWEVIVNRISEIRSWPLVARPPMIYKNTSYGILSHVCLKIYDEQKQLYSDYNIISIEMSCCLLL